MKNMNTKNKKIVITELSSERYNIFIVVYE